MKPEYEAGFRFYAQLNAFQILGHLPPLPTLCGTILPNPRFALEVNLGKLAKCLRALS